MKKTVALIAAGLFLAGASFVGGGLSTAGGYSILLTATGNTSLTLPLLGTVATRANVPYASTQVIGSLIGANFNSTADQAITLTYGGSGFKPSITPSAASAGAVMVKNCSGTPTLAAGTVYSGAGKTGTLFGAVGDTYTGATSATKIVQNNASGNALVNYLTVTTAYFALTTANGSALTCDVYIVATVFP